MKSVSKAIIGSAAAGAMALASASPAFSRDRYGHDGIDAGDVIAGALIIGGIAAIASAGSKNRSDGYYYAGDDRDYRDGRYDRDDRYDRYDRSYNSRGGSARSAVEQCVNAAERDARRAGFRRADVTDIREVDRRNGGYRIKGRIAVDTGYSGSRYGRGWDNDYRGSRNDMRSWDSGKFTCEVSHGRVRDLGYSGIRGLR
ncbi:hypothetical protein EKN06_01235 [Croceicoccus ponticola]|uniref:Uncharacterized protein n=1 Tax=Croceicoccus ponticola TaxID=2217664 RepID=A0A437H008_9SPHN|nr:hypothetical protein [Croceicoccus ponticola]RVQ68882.1 hypothetical protein EKN06_01235 [Croceicoccus ponticola]